MSSPSSSSPKEGSSPSNPNKPADIIKRGVYKTNTLGTLTFIGLRGIEPFLQYQLLRPSGWGTALLSRLGLSTVPLSTLPTLTLLNTTLPVPHWLLLLMPAAGALKQIFWLLRIGREEMTPSAALPIALFNALVDSANSLLFLWTATSPLTNNGLLPEFFGGGTGIPITLALGLALFAAGLALETVPEMQRARFKADPANAGRVCDAGLWGRARHVNYGGYTLWRAGYALAAGGFAWGLAMGAWHMWNFANRSAVALDEYMTGRYGEQWEAHKRRVRWLLIPGVY
ncbi:hypothetical protein VTK56DRAFT_4404 [Thermocarpiscus australiensis]